MVQDNEIEVEIEAEVEFEQLDFELELEGAQKHWQVLQTIDQGIPTVCGFERYLHNMGALFYYPCTSPTQVEGVCCCH